ncbi:MAG: hypothetical protein JWO67_2255 [Streptosporangiaceae bacterium]|nr:hypothetical protein [Streptosporangiaceae bacterium]
MDQSEIESLLWDCVTDPDEDTAYRGDQPAGISKLAALIADQQRSIAELEKQVAELIAKRAVEQ